MPIENPRDKIISGTRTVNITTNKDYEQEDTDVRCPRALFWIGVAVFSFIIPALIVLTISQATTVYEKEIQISELYGQMQRLIKTQNDNRLLDKLR